MKEIISKKQLREFGILIGFGFPLFIGWLIPAFGGHGFRSWTIFVGLLVFVIGISSPSLLYYPYRSWISLGNVLGWVNSKIILGLVFIIVLQPIALVMRVVGYDPLRTRRKRESTYREIRKEHQTDLNRIF